jgi:steroid delta-isomerase-like uncharacterized protein
MRARIFGRQDKGRFGSNIRSLFAMTALGAGAAGLVRRLVRRSGESGTNVGMAQSQENKRIARRAIEEIYNAGRLEAVDELFAPECVSHDVAMPDAIRGRDGIRQQAQAYRSAFPDLRITIDEDVAEGDRVCTRWTARGTHRGELFGMAATNRQATVSGMTIDHLRDGRIVESYTNWDALGLMTQLGTISMPGPAKTKA